MDVNAILENTRHRPWELPRRPWVMRMRWLNLTFLHWPVHPDVLRPLIPAPLIPDLFDGQAWIAVVPFLMSGAGLRLAPPVPGVSEFEELNVRTYVRFKDRPGVWFFSLDAASRLAVAAARITCSLPYFHAVMKISPDNGGFIYESRRSSSRGASVGRFRVHYRPSGEVESYPGEGLERWLTERYCLFTVDARGTVYQLDVHHHPWQLQPAAVEIKENTMGEAAGISLPGPPPLVHYSRQLDVLAWMPFRIGKG